MAAELKSRLGVEAHLIEGDRGEFTVWVDQARVAAKKGDDFPSEEEVVGAVQASLEKTGA